MRTINNETYYQPGQVPVFKFNDGKLDTNQDDSKVISINRSELVPGFRPNKYVIEFEDNQFMEINENSPYITVHTQREYLNEI